MKCTKLLLIGLILLGGVAGCSIDTIKIEQVKIDGIYPSYRVSYDAGTNVHIAGARFRVGGSTGTNIDLGAASTISHNGAFMRAGGLSGLTGKYYEQPIAQYSRTNEFVFSHDGKQWTNSINIERIDFTEPTPEQISINNDFTLMYAGPLLGEGETITLVIDQGAPKQQQNDPFHQANQVPEQPEPQVRTTKQQASVFSSTKAIGQKEVTITAKQLSALKLGSAKLYWVRVNDAKLQEAGPLGGSIKATYRSPARAISLVK